MKTFYAGLVFLFAILYFLLTLAPLHAQDFSADVAFVIQQQRAVGADLSGACGAFRIVKRVAWRLRVTGAGLLSKPSGNNCEGYATDIIAYADGRIVDILIDGGQSNGPAWNPGQPVEAHRWRAAFDPGDVVAPQPVPTPIPVPPVAPVNLQPVLDSIHRLHDTVSVIEMEQRNHIEEEQANWAAAQNAWKRTLGAIVKYVLPALGGLIGGIAAR